MVDFEGDKQRSQCKMTQNEGGFPTKCQAPKEIKKPECKGRGREVGRS